MIRKRHDRNVRMSPTKRTWTDDEILTALEKDPRDIRATLGFMELYFALLQQSTRRIVDVSGKVDIAIQKGTARALLQLSERPQDVSLFHWVWTHVEERAKAIASFPL